MYFSTILLYYSSPFFGEWEKSSRRLRTRSEWSRKECQTLTDLKPTLFFQLLIASAAISRFNFPATLEDSWHYRAPSIVVTGQLDARGTKRALHTRYHKSHLLSSSPLYKPSIVLKKKKY